LRIEIFHITLPSLEWPPSYGCRWCVVEVYLFIAAKLWNINYVFSISIVNF
jgi:hypothetical protein